MDVGGIVGRYIMRVSGHKSEASLKAYSHHVSEAKTREISDTLSKALCTKSKVKCVSTEKTQVTNVSNNLADIDDIFSDKFDMTSVDENIDNILKEFNTTPNQICSLV